MNTVSYTYHAIKEVKHEILKFSEKNYKSLSEITDAEAASFIKDHMRKARFISEIMSEEGKIDRLFAYRRYCFVLDRYDDVVITVYRRDHVHPEIRELVNEVLFEKLAAIQESERLLEAQRLEADITLQLNKVFNERFGASFATQLEELAAWDELKAIDRKLFEFRIKKSKLVKGIAAYV